MKTVYLQRDPEEWQQFVELLEQAVKEDKLEQFFSLFLTPDERGSLGLRTQIVRHLLSNDLSQREIQQKLNTSAATITRGVEKAESVVHRVYLKEPKSSLICC